MSKKPKTHELKDTGYELLVLLVSILSIFNLFVLFLPGFSPVVKGVVRIMDAFTTVLFMIDFLYRFFTAKSKWTYFVKNWGWADLLASMPMHQLKIFRIFRIVKVVRLLRQFGIRNMIREIRDDRAASALYVTVFLVILVLEFGGVAMIQIESPADNANITRPADAIWWAFVTITTVGYGDHYPVTNQGRLVGMFVMTLGVGLFGVLTGFLANVFLSPKKKAAQNNYNNVDADTQIAEFRNLLIEQEKTTAELRARFRELEHQLDGDRTAKE